MSHIVLDLRFVGIHHDLFTESPNDTRNVMPYTFNGIGTMFYGHREEAKDRSYITTEWVTFVYLPLVPIRSLRVLPVGKGTNILIHSSQGYQTVRVPLCWAQVRNLYVCTSPILLLALYFGCPEIQHWVREGVLKKAPQSAAQLEQPQAQPVDVPLSGDDAAVACGKVLKLDVAGFKRLDLLGRLSGIVNSSGFTAEELKGFGSADELQDNAFSSYSLAYLTWEKSAEVSHASLDKILVDAARKSEALKNLSSGDKAEADAYLVKFKHMMLKSFDLGRHDAKLSPCPF